MGLIDSRDTCWSRVEYIRCDMRDSKNSFVQTRSVKKFSQEKKFGSGHREWAGFMLPWRNISLCQKFQKICKENWGRLFIDLQRDGHNKFISKWFTDASISKIGMLTHIWRRITANIQFIYQCSIISSPSQQFLKISFLFPTHSVFLSSDVQTLVSLSGINWSVDWCCNSSSLCHR